MRLEKLRSEVCRSNLELIEKGLVVATFGNVSGIDRESGTVVIKPSGVGYEDLHPENMVLVDLATGRVVEGDLRPSSDTKTHVALYRQFGKIGGIVHTHSKYATAWAQAGKPLPCLGTTQADYFYGEIPCTGVILDEQIERDYEEETAVHIFTTFKQYDYMTVPGVLVASHGPFAWGPTPEAALFHCFMLEQIAELNTLTILLNPDVTGIKKSLLDKHYLRKHGQEAYYGQIGIKNGRK